MFEPEDTCEGQECSVSLTLGIKACLCPLRSTGLRCFHAPLIAFPHPCSWITFQTNCLKNACPVSSNYLTRATYGRVDDLRWTLISQAAHVHFFSFSPVVGTLIGSSKTHGSLGLIDFQGERLVGLSGFYWQKRRSGELKLKTRIALLNFSLQAVCVIKDRQLQI